MVNSQRYARTLQDLNGVAKKIARDTIYRRNPPFMKEQMKYTVDEDKVIKNPPFVEGDRVQVVKGKDKGKVGKIHAIYKDGNCAFVEGVGGATRMILPRAMWLEGQNKPATEAPNPIPYDNLRLVSQIKNADGTVEDVAVHSVSFRGTYYDKERNKMMPIRRAKHHEAMVIPYPVPPTPVAESKGGMATPADVAEERTFYPSTITQSPIVTAALDQIRNPYSKWNKEKKSRKITQIEAELWNAPQMPTPPRTKKLLNELSKMPKRPTVEFTDEIEAFISSEVEKGLQARQHEETKNLNRYS